MIHIKIDPALADMEFFRHRADQWTEGATSISPIRRKDQMMIKHSILAPICALTAAVSVATVMAVTIAAAQTHQPTSPAATQQQPAASSADGQGMPANSMEHGHQMQNMGHKMMETEKGKEGERAGMGAGPMGARPCSPGARTASGGQTTSGDQATSGRASNCM